MKRCLFDLQMKSLRAAFEHLHLLDLAALEVSALEHGSADDRRLLTALARVRDLVPLESVWRRN